MRWLNLIVNIGVVVFFAHEYAIDDLNGTVDLLGLLGWSCLTISDSRRDFSKV